MTIYLIIAGPEERTIASFHNKDDAVDFIAKQDIPSHYYVQAMEVQ